MKTPMKKPIQATVNLAMIVKDNTEVEQLNQCLDTIQPFVNKVFITATGKKVSGIKELCEKRKCVYSYFKWEDDFSKARNFNFKQVTDCDYILWLDADDLFVGGEYLQKVANLALGGEKTGVMFDYWYACTFNGQPSLDSFVKVDLQHPRERLIAPGAVDWVGRLHETPVRKESAKDNYVYLKYTDEDPVAVMHTASIDNSLAKMNRNLRILNLQLEEEKKKGDVDPRTLLHLIKIYSDLDDKELWTKALEYSKEYMVKSGWDEERGVCMAYTGQILQHFGLHRESIVAYHESIREYPKNPLPYLQLANAYYMVGNYKYCKQWLDTALHMDIKSVGATVVNVAAMKVITSNLMTKLAFNVDKDIKKAYESSLKLLEEDPTQENQENSYYLEDLNELNEGCKHLDKYCDYLVKIGQQDKIPSVLFHSPASIQAQPFAIKLLQQNTPVRKWNEKEICYFANFGGKHFFQWDGDSIKQGLGGSETAVIRLSEEWAKKGYKVTVFGDPKKACIINDVTYLPYFYFNRKDDFNIFIQWRNYSLADKVKAKKFYVDLHDVFYPGDYTPEVLKHIDKIFVKSKYHRDLAPKIPDNKIIINSNGITL